MSVGGNQTPTTEPKPRLRDQVWTFLISDDAWKLIWRLSALFAMLLAVAAIAMLYFGGKTGPLDLSKIDSTQGLIAGVLLVTIVLLVLVMIMSALLSEISCERFMVIGVSLVMPSVARPWGSSTMLMPTRLPSVSSATASGVSVNSTRTGD